jgi:hypothetical protein
VFQAHYWVIECVWNAVEWILEAVMDRFAICKGIGVEWKGNARRLDSLFRFLTFGSSRLRCFVHVTR